MTVLTKKTEESWNTVYDDIHKLVYYLENKTNYKSSVGYDEKYAEEISKCYYSI